MQIQLEIRGTSLKRVFEMAEHDITLSLEMPVSDLLRAYPLVSGLFIKQGLACVGCPFNRLCTLGDLPEYYNLDWTNFWDSVNRLLQNI